ncbi:Ser-Thr-rich glycosyl-phosphatidyl-inositol-anchored membrane family-domain-containing protein [Corynascus novoguineensis]|uniref:Ser-Thr-rich glycosyl-phosphatidyl-inositol-anchored membrane family-domain-containing protein n=1 Tax=Corynascus novoguineensis TaxID=1126955 RepID=A0AAN7CRU3_9PEZI|nr:Ser-Thr-rich glycosyl-phosphatidyl-inositol-anchored membrane family-domain-containing protein [Corynascus novoguineensis]
MRVLSLIALAAPLVSAIQFLEPVANSTLKKGETYRVSWSSVDTDPAQFSIFLVNFVDWPPFYTQVASDVQTSAGEHEVTVPCSVNTSWGFQFNAINGTNVYIIHAQTSRFSIRDGACTESGPVSPPDDPSPTCEPVTVTETATSTVTVSPFCAATSSSEPTVSTSSTESVISNLNPSTSSASLSPAPSSSGEPDDECGDEHEAESKSAPTLSDASEQPTVTSPSLINAAEQDRDVDASALSISTVYTTVYRDMSEVRDCAHACKV